jgi:hypothetical protein
LPLDSGTGLASPTVGAGGGAVHDTIGSIPVTPADARGLIATLIADGNPYGPARHPVAPKLHRSDGEGIVDHVRPPLLRPRDGSASAAR